MVIISFPDGIYLSYRSSCWRRRTHGRSSFPVPLSCYSEDAGSEEFLAARCDKIDGIENYRDPEGAGIGGTLSHRISANPLT